MTTPYDSDEELARHLQATLADAGSEVLVSSDGLARIREKVERRRRRLRWWHAGEFVGAAAAVALVVAVSIGSLPLPWHSDSPSTDRITTTGPPPEVLPVSPGPGVGTLATPTSSRTRAVTVYYVGQFGGDPALYAEVHERPVPADGATIRDAIDAMLHEAPRDPTYFSPWPQSTTILGISVKGTKVIVDLSSDTGDAATTGAKHLGRLAALQLLQTVRGAVDASAVALRIDHEPVDSLWGQKIATDGTPEEPLITDAGDSGRAFAPVQIQVPTWGAKLEPTVTFGGQARVFEATVSWEITHAVDGAVVRSGTSMAAAGSSGWGEWSATVTLAPGSYEVRAYAISPKDGSEQYSTFKFFLVERGATTR